MPRLNSSSRIVAYDETFENKVKQSSKNNALRLEEKGYSGELNTRGKKAYFEEYFDGIKLKDQIIPIVGSFENPKETESFIIGYQRGQFLVEHGFNYNDYQAFLEDFAQKYVTENSKKHR